MSDYGIQGCQIIELVFYTKALVNDILVGLERILDYAGAGLERFYCTKNRLNFKNLCKSFLECLIGDSTNLLEAAY